MNKYRFFQHKECEYFPCHQLDHMNCMFCYCPAYPYSNCPGNPIFLENGVKDCSKCLFPHLEKNYDALMAFLSHQNHIEKVENPQKIASLFQKSNETMIWSYLDGYKGEAYVDSMLHPTSAMIMIGDLCFFAGVPNRNLVMNVKKNIFILAYLNSDWETVIESCYGDKIKKHIRYATKKDTTFDIHLLQNNVQQLSNEYCMKPIDHKIYQQLLKEDWSKDLCSVYDSYDEYQRFGIGYVIYHDDMIVSGASAYTYYQKGIEIEIDTHPDYRRQGLARIVASKLILECLKNNLYPSWDAHTLASLQLALQLGYQEDYSYPVYLMK